MNSMAPIKVTELELPGVKLIEPKYFEDQRGYFCETYSAQALAEYGIKTVFVQDNQSLSVVKGTIRGIHFQNAPRCQTKLVRCTHGKIMDYVVDLRHDSPTFKKWICVELSEENHRQLYIPKGFGHAFITLVDNCILQYKVDDFYAPECDRSIAYNDPELGIDWGSGDLVFSEKDLKAPKLADSDINLSMALSE